MNITEEELQRIVALAVRKALEEIKGVHGQEEGVSEPPVQYGGSSVQPFSDEELEEAMRLMASNRGKDGEPKVGIFWFDPNKNDLFGVRSHRVSDYVKPNARSEFGCVSCSEMHEDVWKKEYHKQKYKNGGVGPYTGAYEMVPRGRIFYDPRSDEFTIAVGSWIEQYPQAIPLIEEEFNLKDTKHTVKTAWHWDIGQKWI
ncbi:MAG: hypothetical protein J6S48_06140 [Bacteroidales bacterium]|jgi:hypothetical protein|nr:hypothetical protein [Bacteroidales bacterium]